MSRQTIIVLIIVCSGIIIADAQMCKKDGIKFGKGQAISVPGKCMEVTCQDPVTNRQTGLTCAYSSPPRGCRLSSTDYSKPYPQCCPRNVC